MLKRLLFYINAMNYFAKRIAKNLKHPQHGWAGYLAKVFLSKMRKVALLHELDMLNYGRIHMLISYT